MCVLCDMADAVKKADEVKINAAKEMVPVIQSTLQMNGKTGDDLMLACGCHLAMALRNGRPDRPYAVELLATMLGPIVFTDRSLVNDALLKAGYRGLNTVSLDPMDEIGETQGNA